MISIYIRNKDICPASYYRITQYMNDVQGVCFNNIASDRMFRINQQVDRSKIIYHLWRIIYFIHMTLRGMKFEIRDIFKRPEVIMVSRSIFPHWSSMLGRRLLKIITERSRCVIWDFDDDIFLNGEISSGEREILEKNATKIVVTHDYLKGLLEEKYQKKVVIMPTTDGDFDKFIHSSFDEERMKTLKDFVELIWVGQAVGLKYFDNILKELDDSAEYIYLALNKKMRLTIVCNKPLKADTKWLEIINRQWSKNAALYELCKAHIGIMPLNEEKYVLGKGGFKLIQYMSASLPVIGSNVGYNKEIIDENIGFLVQENQWKEAIIKLVENDKDWLEKSHKAREKWKEKYNYMSQKEIWRELIK